MERKIKHTIDNWRLNWRRKPFLTYGFLIISILMYIIMSFNGGSQNTVTLITHGAKVNPLIVAGDWWRLLTPIFLHIGFAHLLFNGLIIYFLGTQIEILIGHFRYFLLYILSGLLGNATSFALNFSISAGASTSIFGLFAATIVLGKLYPHQAGIQRLARNYLFLIIINIVFGLFSAGVDNAGHIGGLAGGFFLMYVISAPGAWNNPRNNRIKYGIIYVVVLVVLIAIGFYRTSNAFM